MSGPGSVGGGGETQKVSIPKEFKDTRKASAKSTVFGGVLRAVDFVTGVKQGVCFVIEELAARIYNAMKKENIAEKKGLEGKKIVEEKPTPEETITVTVPPPSAIFSGPRLQMSVYRRFRPQKGTTAAS
jgi:hypothetical protein